MKDASLLFNVHEFNHSIPREETDRLMLDVVKSQREIIKLTKIKSALKISKTDQALTQLSKIKNLNNWLSVSTEELTDLSDAQKLDIYKSNMDFMIGQHRDKLKDTQALFLNSAYNNVKLYQSLLNLLYKGVDPTDAYLKLETAIKRDNIQNFKTVSLEDYEKHTKLFKNRLAYFLSHITNKSSLQTMSISDVVGGCPGAEILTSSNNRISVKPPKFKSKARLSRNNWNSDNLIDTFNSKSVESKVVCKNLTNIIKKSLESLALNKSNMLTYEKTILTEGMVNLINDYIDVNKTFIQMVAEIIKK